MNQRLFKQFPVTQANGLQVKAIGIIGAVDSQLERQMAGLSKGGLI